MEAMGSDGDVELFVFGQLDLMLTVLDPGRRITPGDRCRPGDRRIDILIDPHSPSAPIPCLRRADRRI